MELPIINRVSEFKASLNSLSSPSFISRVLPKIFQLGDLSESIQLWKLGALLLALVCTFTHVIRKIKIFIFNHPKNKIDASSSLSDSFLSDFSDIDSEYDNDDEDHEVCSSSYSSDDEETTLPSSDNLTMRFDDFRVAGGSSHYGEKHGLQNRESKLRRRRSIVDILSLSELVNCKSVVKLWDGLGLRVGLNEIDCGIDSLFASTPAVPSSSSSLVVSAKSECIDGTFGFTAWDTRMSRENPAIHAEWKPERRSEAAAMIGTNSVGGGVGKVYIRDEVSRDLTVGDLRRVDYPLGNVTEYDDEEDDATCTFWDADAFVSNG